VYDAGEDGEGPWLAMELIHGVSLRHVLDRRGSLPVEQVSDSIRQAAAGLERGLGHRDIKPQNFMVGDDSRVRLTDFGLVRPVTQETPITAEGTVLGSVRQPAPRPSRAGKERAATSAPSPPSSTRCSPARSPFDAPTTASC